MSYRPDNWIAIKQKHCYDYEKGICQCGLECGESMEEGANV